MVETTNKIPLPNELFDGGIVVASVWGNDYPEYGPYSATLLILLPEPPYYRIDYVEFKDGEWHVEVRHSRENIVPAVECYEENGGDY